MSKIVEVDNNKYEIVKDYREGFVLEDFKNRCTDYFYDFDYIVGDIAYGKLRLKGFYDEKNKKVNKINNFKNLDNYLQNYCAPDCKYFVIKKK